MPVDYLLKLWGETAVDEAEAESFFQSKHYFSIGLEHILQGYDHLLFIIGLLLLPLNFRHLVALVSTFTLAHSLTLALSVFNLVRFPAALVEAFIAGSIVYVAVENLWHLRSSKGKTSQLSPWQRRMIMTFLFGLIHGFGFSYLLTEIGLGEQVVGALLYFNLGVEVGQLL
ncbi:MAG: HupE/UreJ family protein, partial [Oleispira sp.]|nr:HupE/UreJ family protein [Oleispira sp.]